MRTKRGRPKLPDDKRRVQLNMKVRPDVKVRLLAVSAILGKSVSRLMEDVIDNTYWS